MAAVYAMTVGIGFHYQPATSIVEVTAMIGVNVGVGKIVPNIVVIIVAASSAVDVVARSVVPKATIVVVAAAGMVVVSRP